MGIQINGQTDTITAYEEGLVTKEMRKHQITYHFNIIIKFTQT